MITTIDKAGRLVIPKALRSQFHLTPNSEVELVADGDCIKLSQPKRESHFIEIDGVLVQASETPAQIDSTAFINELRTGRSREQASLEGGQ